MQKISRTVTPGEGLGVSDGMNAHVPRDILCFSKRGAVWSSSRAFSRATAGSPHSYRSENVSERMPPSRCCPNITDLYPAGDSLSQAM